MINAQDFIIKARAQLMKGNVGMASMLLNLDLVEETDSSRCDTMATDGKRIYFNSEWVMDLSMDEVQGVLIHEALHVVYEHPFRRGSRHPKVWNIACDYAINNYLRYELGLRLPLGGVWDRKYTNMTAEQIYRDLINDDESLQEAIDQIQDDNEEHNPKESEDDSEGEGSEGNSEEGEEDERNQTGQGNISDEDGKKTSANAEGKEEKIDLDSIPDAIGKVLDAQDEEGKPLNEAEMQELQGEVQRAVSLADKLESAMGGSGSSSGLGGISGNEVATISWKEILRELLSSVSEDTSWNRLNKRHQWRGINLPSRTREPQGGELAIAIDTSSSVSQQELNIFASEIQAMAEDCGLDKIRVCYCTTSMIKNSEGNFWDIYDLSSGEDLELQVRGGGGTSFEPPFNLYNNFSDDVDDVQAFIYFTDGEGSCKPEVEPDVPVFWCISRESSWSRQFADTVAFGEPVFVDVADFY